MDEDFEFEAAADNAAAPDEFVQLSDNQQASSPSEFQEQTTVMPQRANSSSSTGSIPQQANHDGMLRRTSSDAMSSPAPSEATNKWKAENEKKIKQRDAEFAKAKQELTNKAKQAAEKLASERAQTIAKNAKANREVQAKTQAAAGSKPAPGAPVDWKKLAQLIDLDKETTDKERMRLLFKARVTEAK